MKKRTIVLALVLVLIMGALSACAGPKNSGDDYGKDGPIAQEHDSTPINIMALKGPTAMGMVQMMDAMDNEGLDGHEYTFTLAGAPDEVAPAIVQGTVDFAAVPANLASVLYNKTEGGVQVLAVNTLGVLYIVERGENINSVADLAGKTIYASGKGATPEYALNYLLTENGLDPGKDVTIEWKSEHAECLSALLADENAIAMLPQPFVTTAVTKAEGLRAALDLTEEWEAVQSGEASPSRMITGVLIARKAFVDEHPEAVDDFLRHYKESVEFTNGEVDAAAALIGAYDIVPEAVAKLAIPECNIVYIDGSEMKDALSGYLSVLYAQDPASVGGALPEDGFYYVK
ncbi:MAG: ABC transporter substrate-binding protein [Firmicutes bacterium]|nr:ABC transporter substrate-binding protein [Bacillota bacterium]MBR3053334.1 ABC transporter substrate-binding protein [Bacillota bacterium]